MISGSVERVPSHTSSEVNEQIVERIKNSLRCYAHAPRELIEARLGELDREWDIERAIEANAASLSLLGLGLAATGNRKWLALPAVVAGFLLQHSIQGWCPPVPILRRLGFRTAQEIEEERYGLKGLRGDFEEISTTENEEVDVERVYRQVAHHHNGHSASITQPTRAS